MGVPLSYPPSGEDPINHTARLLMIVWSSLMALLAPTKAGVRLWFCMNIHKERGTERLSGLSAFAWAAIVFVAASYLMRNEFMSGLSCQLLTRAHQRRSSVRGVHSRMIRNSSLAFGARGNIQQP